MAGGRGMAYRDTGLFSGTVRLGCPLSFTRAHYRLTMQQENAPVNQLPRNRCRAVWAGRGAVGGQQLLEAVAPHDTQPGRWYLPQRSMRKDSPGTDPASPDGGNDKGAARLEGLAGLRS